VGLSTTEGAEANSIAIANNGKFHISYYDKVHHKLKYISEAGDFLILKDIDSFASSNYSNKNFIVTDSSNRASVLYNTINNSDICDIKSAKDASDGFSPQIEATDISSMGSGKAIDSHNNIHICYVDNGALSVKAVGSGTSELIQNSRVDSCAIAIDVQDHLHIVFVDSSDSDIPSIKYAHKIGSIWKVETLVYEDPKTYALTADHYGKVHLVYSIDRGLSLKDIHLSYSNNITGKWKTKLINNAVDAASIAISSDDTVHISYYNIEMGDLQHTWFKVKHPVIVPILYLLQ
jgi:hypothetical protein